MKVWALMLMLGCAAGNASAEPIQSYDEYGSWLVACDNTLSCVAKGFGDGGVRAELRIERGAGPEGGLSARIAAEATFDPAAIAVDDAALPLSLADWTLDSADALTMLASARPEAVRSLVARLRDGDVLRLGPEAEVPLDGLVAALLRMDERQGRVGGATALIRAGEAPAGRVPPPPPLPKIPHRPVNATLASGEAMRLAEAVRSEEQAVLAEAGCQEDRISLDPGAYALDASRALLLVPCLMGAYQGSALAFVVSRTDGRAEQLVLPVPYRGNDPDHATAALFTEGDFDPATGTLWMSARGRGLADCGMTASWIWDGSLFRLADLALQQSCGGTEPGDWPTLFRSGR